MKKAIALLLAAVLAFSVCACTNNVEESSSSSSEPSSSAEVSVPQTLSFDGIDFTFTIPARWNKDDFTVKVVKDAVMSGQEVEYSHVDFLFQNDTDAPLLSILAAPKAWWDDQQSMGADLPDLIQERGTTVYLAAIPDECPVSDKDLAKQYEAMAITLEEVKAGLKLTNEPSSSTETAYIEGVLQDGTMNTITILTDDGKELLFGKEGAEVNEPDGLIIGDRLRIYYDGAINGTDTSGVTVSKIEKVS